MKTKKLHLILFCFCTAGAAQAQETIGASGANASGSGGTVSYTLGQVAYSYQSDGAYTITAGVQQAYDLAIGIAETGIDLNVSAYPNPTTDFLTLDLNPGQYQNLSERNLAYKLVDLQGKLILESQIQNAQETINMLNESSGIYFLSITENGTVIQTFRISKNN